MTIKDNSIWAVKDAINIEQVVGHFVELKPKGATYWGCCPFHNENSPSFAVTPAKGIYKCFGCGKAGDAIGFLAEKENMDFPEAIEWLADFYKITLEYDKQGEHPDDKEKRIGLSQVLKASLRAWRNALYDSPIHGLPQLNLKWPYGYPELEIEHRKVPSTIPAEYLLSNRQLPMEVIDEWELGFAPDDYKFLTGRIINSGSWQPAYELGIVKSKESNNYDAFRNRIIYPIHNHRGELVGFGARSIDHEGVKTKRTPKFLNSAASGRYNKSEILYGLHKALPHIRQSKRAILVEGYNDAIMMRVVGQTETVATCGTAFTKEQAILLSRWATELLVFYDGDDAGAAAARKAVDLALEVGQRVRVCLLPNKQDPDDFCRKAVDDSQWEAIRYRLDQEREEPKGVAPATTANDKVEGYIIANEQDGLMWKAQYTLDYWGKDDPDNYAEAIDRICEMLLFITHPTKRSSYIDKLYKEHKLSKKMLANRIAAIQGELNSKKVKRGKEDEREELGLPEKADIDIWKRHAMFELERESYFSKGDGWERQANFVLDCKYLVKRHEDDPIRIYEMENEFRQKEKLAMPSDALVSLPAFKSLLVKYGNFRFWGPQNSLDRWQGKLYEQEEVITEVSPLGWFPAGKFYAMANGIHYDGKFYPTDEEGLVEKDGKTFFIRAFSTVQFENSRGFEFEQRFKHNETEVTFSQWAALIERVYKRDGILMICYVMAAVFRSIVFKRFTFFPILNMFGPPGSGKNQIVQSVLRLFGEPQEMFNLHGGTLVGFKRKLGQLSDAIISFTEYKNDVDHKIVEALKSAYDGIGHEKGVKSNDNRTTTTKVLSAIMIDGQHMPNADVALMERIIYISLQNRDDYDLEAFTLLKQVERDGVTNVLVNMLDCRAEMEAQFDDNFDLGKKELSDAIEKKMDSVNVKDRILNNYAIIYAAFKVMAPKLGNPIMVTEVRSTIVDRIIEHSMQLRSGADVAQFWQVVNSLFNSNFIHQDKELDVTNMKLGGVMRRVLVIRLNVVHPLYMKEFKGTRLKSEGMEMGALLFYLKGCKDEYIDSISGHRFGDFNTSGHIFDYEKLVEKYDIALERNKGSYETPKPIEQPKEEDIHTELPYQ